jgi:hypothetical protein
LLSPLRGERTFKIKEEMTPKLRAATRAEAGTHGILTLPKPGRGETAKGEGLLTTLEHWGHTLVAIVDVGVVAHEMGALPLTAIYGGGTAGAATVGAATAGVGAALLLGVSVGTMVNRLATKALGESIGERVYDVFQHD